MGYLAISIFSKSKAKAPPGAMPAKHTWALMTSCRSIMNVSTRHMTDPS